MDSKKIIKLFFYISILLLIIEICISIKNEVIVLNLKLEIKNKSYINDEYEETIEKITNKVSNLDTVDIEISLLEKRKKQNDELLEILDIDRENITNSNNEVEQQLIYFQNLEIKNKNQVFIDDVITYNQFPNYPTGCESIALYILLKYYNINVTPDDIISNIVKGELPYSENGIIYGGNPETEFVGTPNNKYSYGVYNKPIEDVANRFKHGVNSKIGLEFEDMLNIVRMERPVMVWTTIGLSKPFISKSWIYKPTGDKIQWISGEHAVVVIGYNQNSNQIIVSDPYTGTIRYFNLQTFKERYDFLGKRAIYY